MGKFHRNFSVFSPFFFAAAFFRERRRLFIWAQKKMPEPWSSTVPASCGEWIYFRIQMRATPESWAALHTASATAVLTRGSKAAGMI